MRPITVALLLGLFHCSLALAQQTGGRIEGRLVKPDSTGLDEVQLRVTGTGLLGTRETYSDRSGRFQFPALPVGTYSLSARRIGFQPVLVENISVRLGETTNLQDVTVSATPVELAGIEVTTPATFDPTETGSRTTLDARQLDVLPLSRDFRDIALLAPTSIPSYLGRAGGVPDGVNISGATGIENTYYLDGINITDVFHGGAGLDLPYNFVDQIEIGTGGSTAEDAQALGGVVNVVTPNGGDRLRASVFGFYSSDELRTDPKVLLGSTETGFRLYDVGVRVDGPVLRRQLSFFGAYNWVSEKREHSLAFGPADNTNGKHLFAAKLNWRAGPHTSAAFTIIGDPSHSEGLGGSIFGAGVPIDPDGLRRRETGGGIGLSASASHFLTPKLVLEGTLAQSIRDGKDEPATPAGRAPIVIDEVDGTLSGGGGIFSSHHSRRRSAGAALTWQLGSHNLRTGVLYELLYLSSQFDASRPSLGTIIRADTNVWSWHSNHSGPGVGENRTPSVFIQDAWQIRPRLALTAGLRWSRQTVHNLTSETINFRVQDGLQPRVGVVFQPGTTGAQRVYASYGRVANQLTLRGVDEGNGFGAETLFVFPQDPRVDTTGGTIDLTTSHTGGFGSDGTLRGETADEWAIGYDRHLGRRVRVSLRGVIRVHRDAVQLGLEPTGVLLMGNPGHGALARFPLPRRTYHAVELTLEHSAEGRWPWLRVSYVLSRTRGNYSGLYGSDWSLDFGHVGPLYLTPEQHENGTGLLPNDRPHVLKAFGAHPVSSRLVVGAFFLLASGTPISEYGGISGLAAPFRKLVRQRGTRGRTPTIWDLGLRTTYEMPTHLRPGSRARLLLDLEHIGSPRAPVDYDQVHFTCLDDAGTQSCPNAGYGRVTQYQLPMTARLGVEMGF
jgi:Carboxypeptidase regulatory-like domain/TonB dependent receptor